MVNHMGIFKKAFFGGYKKSEVDAAVNELNMKLEESDSDKNRFKKELQNAEKRIAELEKELSDLGSENFRLSSDLARAEAVYEDIDKLNKHVFGEDAQAVSASREAAQKALNDIGDRCDKATEEIKRIIDGYETVHRDINTIIEAFKRDMNCAAQTAEIILDSAKAFVGIGVPNETAVDSASENVDSVPQTEEKADSDFSVLIDAAAVAAEESVENSVGNTAAEASPAEQAENAPDTAPADDVAEACLPEEKGSEPVVGVKKDQDKPAAPKSDGGFTQYGRKSKISAEDRSELLRKALLKSGGN